MKFILVAFALSLTIPRIAEAACDGGAAFVQGKTPIHRGPGLNYPVASFLEMGRCMKMTQTSADKAWVLVEDGNLIGWVSIDRLDAKSIMKTEEKPKAEVGPIGSGQSRGFVNVVKKTLLRQEPALKAASRRNLEVGTKLLALSITSDKKFVEVRTERGSETGWVKRSAIEDPSNTLASLPILDKKLETGIVSKKDPAPNVVGKTEPIVPKDEADEDGDDKPPQLNTELSPDAPKSGPDFEVRILGVASLPSRGLDSNGSAGIRRYDIAAYTGGVKAEAAIDGLGPIRLRAGYAFVPMPGLKPKGAVGPKIFSHEHDAHLSVGLPIALGIARLIPEVGYQFSLHTIRPALPGGQAQFFSSVAHLAAAGLSALIALGETLDINLSAAALLGFTKESPFDLGKPGATYGVRASGGVGIHVTESFMVVAEYGIIWSEAQFKGASLLDPTITKASLTRLEHGLSVGAAILF
jgi:hypothetical protein